MRPWVRPSPYSGTLGRIDNCQVATSLHLAGARGSGCIGMWLYLPEAWTTDRARCRTAGVALLLRLTGVDLARCPVCRDGRMQITTRVVLVRPPPDTA
ncbi:MAG: transposase [Vicinamibacterales bacterium]